MHRTILCLEALKEIYAFETLLIGLVRDLELREWRVVELQGERLAVEPERDVVFRQALLAIQAKVPEPHAAKAIQPARELMAEKDTMDALRLPDGASHPA